MELDDMIEKMKALSDPNRVRAVLALEQGELCVCQLIELLKLAPSTVSKHMSILKYAKLVVSRKEGRWIYYSINRKAGHWSHDILALVILGLVDAEDIIIDNKELKQIKRCSIEEICKHK